MSNVMNTVHNNFTKSILKTIDRYNKKLVLLHKELNLHQSKTLVQCTSNLYGKGCSAWTAIRYLEYIQTYWYVSPSGCTDGDYWKPSEGQFICPNCKHKNRLYDRPEIEKLKHCFGSIVDYYK